MSKALRPLRFPRRGAGTLVLGALALAGHTWAAAAGCAAGPAPAAKANSASLASLVWPLEGKSETGWAIYAPLVGHEIGTVCPPDSPAFAAALARWQAAHKVSGAGEMDAATMQAMNQVWLSHRPFVAQSAKACPAPPAPSQLARATPAESFGGKTIELRPEALAAYRAMVAAARRALPEVRADPRLLTIFSGFRSPDADAARCASQGNCQGRVRASCSAHRTGLALDLDLGAAPGERIDSSDDAHRLFISRSAAYRWLVWNAGRFGFAPYPFEPWHWEWRGEAR